MYDIPWEGKCPDRVGILSLLLRMDLGELIMAFVKSS